MMSADTANALYSRILATTGETLILRRAAVSDLSFRGVINQMSMSTSPTSEVASGRLIQYEYSVIMGATEIAAAAWPLPIKKGDKIVSGSKVYAVEKADEVRINGILVRLNLVVKG